MTPTDELRAMLDERGVEWTNPNTNLRDEMTSWVANGFDYDAFEVPDGTLVLTAAYQDDLTPEQAIAATLGAGTCEWCKNGKTFDGQTVMMSNHGWQVIRHCPNCGRRLLK